jgi:DNA-binding CsgD family transcriptional regulator
MRATAVLPSLRVSVDPNQPAGLGPTTEYAEAEATDLGTPYLELVKGMPAAPPVRLTPGAFVLGRDAAADITYAVEGVSRKHARVTVEPSGEVRVVDLASRNGTWLNGRRVEDASLRDGDELRIGPVGLRLRYVGAHAQAPAAPATAASPDLPLSARELEVARLVADGMTNAEIGARLHISPATVGRHLSNVYERLGIHSRAALAARLASR